MSESVLEGERKGSERHDRNFPPGGRTNCGKRVKKSYADGWIVIYSTGMRQK